jgi:multidrug transporter EmrE-like cation transporter
MKWLILIVGVGSNALASILLKIATQQPHVLPTFNDPLKVLTNWPLITGVLFYAVAFISYILALQKLPLNVAHPIMTAGAIALVAVCSSVYFKESFNLSTLIGVFFIVIGVIFLTFRMA